MRAGQLRYRVTLQQPDATEQSGFADVDTVWAEMQFAPATNEAIAAGGVTAIGTQRVRIRYRADVRASWRLTMDDRVFQINGYGDPDGRRRELLLVCAEAQ